MKSKTFPLSIKNNFRSPRNQEQYSLLSSQVRLWLIMKKMNTVLQAK